MDLSGAVSAAGVAEQRLLFEARTRRPRALRNREAIGIVAGGATFLAAAVTFAVATSWGRPLDVGVLVGLTLGFAVLTQFELEIASGSAVPTQLLFVPMLFLLPLPLVPLAVLAGYTLGGLYEVARGRRHLLRLGGLAGCCWFSLPPALVLFAAGRSTPASWHNWPILVAAFAAQCLGDFAHTAAHERVAHDIPARQMLEPLGRVYAFDALLSPLALLGAIAATRDPLSALALVPLGAILAVLSHERTVRVGAQLRAGEFEEIAKRDSLTKLRNRRELLTDIEQAIGDGTRSVLAILDLDEYKTYNDRFGHVAGDSLLRRFGRALDRAGADVGARAYRLGGDEFCVLSPVPEDVEALLDACVAALTFIDADVRVTASYGTVFLPDEADTATRALRTADVRLSREKMTRYAARGGPDAVLLQALREREPDLDPNSSRVAELAYRIGQALGLEQEALENLRQAALLHDVGMLAISDQILHKPAALDSQERAMVERHTVIGERILNASPALSVLAPIVRSTHEHWDGSGYPDRLVGTAAPLESRIIAVCAAFDAMTNDRPYRSTATADHARAELRREAGRQFDPALVEILLDLTV